MNDALEMLKKLRTAEAALSAKEFEAQLHGRTKKGAALRLEAVDLRMAVNRIRGEADMLIAAATVD